MGLALAAAVAAWTEWWLLQRTLAKRIGTVRPSLSALGRMFAAAMPAAAVARGVAWLLPEINHILEAALVVGAFAVVYGVVTLMLGLNEAKAIVRRVRGILRR